mmetsp:Transcript_18650/g.43609  ORF Transcript_18650/g.43609 Transcript_18650/m.43609 type:complete len:140 (-) Transcript_18650:216-635(-)
MVNLNPKATMFARFFQEERDVTALVMATVHLLRAVKAAALRLEEKGRNLLGHAFIIVMISSGTEWTHRNQYKDDESSQHGDCENQGTDECEGHGGPLVPTGAPGRLAFRDDHEEGQELPQALSPTCRQGDHYDGGREKQ